MRIRLSPPGCQRWRFATSSPEKETGLPGYLRAARGREFHYSAAGLRVADSNEPAQHNRGVLRRQTARSSTAPNACSVPAPEHRDWQRHHMRRFGCAGAGHAGRDARTLGRGGGAVRGSAGDEQAHRRAALRRAHPGRLGTDAAGPRRAGRSGAGAEAAGRGAGHLPGHRHEVGHRAGAQAEDEGAGHRPQRRWYVDRHRRPRSIGRSSPT